MAEFVIVRTVEMDAERAQRAGEWMKQTEQVRREHGMRQQLIAQKVIDRRMYLLVQVWEDEDTYQAWRRSEARARLVREAPRDYQHASTSAYRTL